MLRKTRDGKESAYAEQLWQEAWVALVEEDLLTPTTCTLEARTTEAVGGRREEAVIVEYLQFE